MELLNKSGKDFSFLRVKSHCAIKGNMILDQIAKESSGTNKRDDTALIFKEFYPKLKNSQIIKCNRVYKNHIQRTPTNSGLMQNKISRTPWYNSVGLNFNHVRFTLIRLVCQLPQMWKIWNENVSLGRPNFPSMA